MLVLSVIVISLTFGSWSEAAKPDDFGLKEGDLISAIFSDDPDVYIINEHGYKRLFLNPEIFNFYGHLGGFFNVKLVTQEVRDSFVTSGLFRDCESNDEKVYGVDIDGEDTGQLRWINTTGEQAVSDDPDFFKKVFCINQKEFQWYPRGTNLNTVKDVPRYDRMKEIEKVATKEKLEAKAELKDVGQVVICHYPPGNVTAYQTLTVGASALKAHLDHGDTVGTCPVVVSPTPTLTPTPSITPTPTPMVTITPSPIASPSYSPTPTPTPTSTPAPDTLGPWITNLSISPSTGNPGQIVTFSVTAQDPAGIGNVIYDIYYPNSTYVLRPNCNFNGATSGTCSFSESVDHGISPTLLGDYVIKTVRTNDKLGNMATYYPNGTVTNSSQNTHNLNIPAITISAPASLVIDNFNSYTDGRLWNQGGWIDVVNAESFIVQSASVNEGLKGVSNDYHDGPAIITKLGTSLSNGRQSLYFKTNNRAGWTSNEDGNIQIRITKGQFRPPYGNYSSSPSMNSPAYHPAFFLAVTLRKDGHVTYYDPSLMSFKNFDTYNDGEWTRLEVEWRSGDSTARYRVNNGVWTNWIPFYGGNVFTSFDTLNLIIDNRIYFGTGEVFFDNLN